MDAAAEGEAGEAPQTKAQAKRRGHGRRSADSYTGATVVACAHPELRPGDACPQPGCRGHLYDTRSAQIFIQLTGQPIVAATRYEQAVLRCSSCQQRLAAPLPAEVWPQKYDATCDVAIALQKYGMGLPWYRLARQQELCGVPVPESVQYERCEVVAAALRPVYREMLRAAAQAGLIYVDDTSVKILSCECENKQLPAGSIKRRQTQTTGVVADLGEGQRLALYFSGRQHAGENITALLSGRPSDLSPPIQMSDALSRNWSGEAKRVCAKCWARRPAGVYRTGGELARRVWPGARCDLSALRA